MAAFGSRGIHVHDPSTIVKCGTEFWIFYTGRGVPSYHSKDLIHWKSGPCVFTNAPAWTFKTIPKHRGDYFWAPDIIHLKNRCLLYYAVSVFGKNTSAIGLATNPTLDPANPKFHWSDCGIVIQSTTTNHFNAIDPSVYSDAGGKLWLAFGSFWSGVKLIQLNPETGKPIVKNPKIYSLAFNDKIEAPCLYHHNGFYYLFVNWGLCCRGTNSTYEIRVGRSKKITGPYLDKDGTDMIVGGGSVFLKSNGPFIGPGHAGIFSENGTNWLSCHFYDGTHRGISILSIMPLRWNANGWPEIY